MPTDSSLSKEEVDRGLSSVLRVGVAGQAMTTLTEGVFLVLLANELNAPLYLIGLLAAIPPLAQLVQIPSVYLFNEFLLIEIIRSILGAEPRCFFVLLSVSRRLRAQLDLKYIDDLERYKYFKRKIKNLKGRLREISKRSLGTEGDESFAFDSSIVTADLNGYRNGKKVKKGEYGARFTYSTTKGTVIGFQALLLFNLEKFSVRKFEIYPINASTKKNVKENGLRGKARRDPISTLWEEGSEENKDEHRGAGARAGESEGQRNGRGVFAHRGGAGNPRGKKR